MKSDSLEDVRELKVGMGNDWRCKQSLLVSLSMLFLATVNACIVMNGYVVTSCD